MRNLFDLYNGETLSVDQRQTNTGRTALIIAVQWDRYDVDGELERLEAMRNRHDQLALLSHVERHAAHRATAVGLGTPG